MVYRATMCCSVAFKKTLMRKVFSYTLLFLALAILSFSCNKNDGDEEGPPDPGGPDRKALLVNVATNIIVPSFEQLGASVGELNAAAEAFAESPDENGLTALRVKWKNAYLAWQRSEMFHFGPADDNGLRNYFNIYPTDVTMINLNVAGGVYNLELLVNNKVQGFPALDYLINGLDDNDAGIVSYYTGVNGEGWKSYLTDVTAVMVSKLTTVVNAWKGSYQQDFTNNTGTGAGSSFSKMVNEYIMYFERFLRSGKYAIPAGVMSGTAAPEKVEAYYDHGFGTELARTALHAARDFYRGKSFSSSSTGAGLKSYLEALNKNTLATDIDAQFGTIDTHAENLGSSIYLAIVNDRNSVLDLYDEFQTQVRYLKVDMVSAIGISITYTDNDGD